MDPNSPSHIGRYELLDRLGEGGMGVVYLARDPLLGRTVAIKVLSVYNEELRYRFAREARSSAALKHNNIVTIYDIGDDQGRPFIAMEYLDGETMAELIRRRAPMSVVRKVQLVLELCAGLGYAHRNGIIHRDIKPANVMITADGVLKILDFGLARLATEAGTAGFTRVGALLGTPQYMSPEQIEGHTIDHRSDIFAVGLVLYEFLALRKAYTGETPHAVLHKILNSDPQPVRELVPDLDPDLESIIGKAIEKDPKRRYQNLGLLASDLERVRNRLQTLSGDPTVRLDRTQSGRAGKAPPPKDAPATTPRGLPNLDAIAKRRAAQIQHYLDEAQKRLDASEFDQAIEHCEAAAVIDPNDRKVLEMLDRACRGAEDRRVRLWLDEASGCLSRGAFSEAGRLVEQALQLRPTSPDAQGLQKEIKDRQREQERAAERVRAARAALDRARVKFGEGAYEAAIRSTNEALAYDAGNEDARVLKQQAMELLAEERRRQEYEHQAFDLVARGRVLAVGGQWQDALQLLRAFDPPHDIVNEAIVEIEREIESMERQRRAEEEEQRRRIDHERLAAETVAEARSFADGGRFDDALALLRAFAPEHEFVDSAIVEVEREAAEAERRRQEEAARQRAIEEEARRRRELEARAAAVVGESGGFGEAELEQALALLQAFEPAHDSVTAAIADVQGRIEARDARLREEEAARQRALEEERRRQEEERLAREREEARVREEEALRQQALEEARRQEEERLAREREEARLREEEALRQQALEEARRQEEERLAREREEARLREEEAARQQALEEERRQQEEERLAREREEARRREEEAARQQALEQERLRSEAEAARRREEETRRLQAEEDQRRREAERQRSFDEQLEAAAAKLEAGELQAALDGVQAALKIAKQDERARSLYERVREAIEARKQQEKDKRGAETAIGRARKLSANGDFPAAIRTLEKFQPAPLVAAVLDELKTEWRAREQRREEEAARKKQETLEAKARQEEAERRARDEAEARRRAAEEAEAQRRLEAQRVAEEEARQKAAAEEEVRRKAAAEEEARRKAADEQERRRAAEAQARAAEETRQQLEARQLEARQRDEAERQRQERERAEALRVKEQAARTGPQPAERVEPVPVPVPAPPVPAPAPVRKSMALPIGIAAGVVAALVVAGIYMRPGTSSPPAANLPSGTTAGTPAKPEPPPTGAKGRDSAPPAPAPATPAAEPPAAAAGAAVPLVIDATPWGRVERIVDASGKPVDLPGSSDRSTPLVVPLPPGDYKVTLRGPDGKTQTKSIRVTAAGATVSIDFAKIDPADYFKRGR